MGIGNNLKQILLKKKMTIIQLSELSGISKNTLYSITKRDSSNVNSSVLTAISKALNISPFELTVDIEKLSAEAAICDDIAKLFGSDAVNLLSNYNLLNEQGKNKALEYLNDLTEQPKYTKKEPPPAATESDSE